MSLAFWSKGRLCDIYVISSRFKRFHDISERQWSLLKYRKKNISICKCDPSKHASHPHKQLWLVAFVCSLYQMSESLSLTHWGGLTHICVSDLTSIGSDNGLSPGRRQAIIRTNAGILIIRPFGTNFSEILIEIIIFSFKKMRLKVSSAKRRPFCLGLNVLTAAPR